jgi:hypothetical protein
MALSTCDAKPSRDVSACATAVSRYFGSGITAVVDIARNNGNYIKVNFTDAEYFRHIYLLALVSGNSDIGGKCTI